MGRIGGKDAGVKASKPATASKPAQTRVGGQRLMARPRMMARPKRGATPDEGTPPGVSLRPDGSIRPDPGAPHVLIIGGGGTGGALAHDLTLRGLRVTLVERGEVTSGTTGRHHGLLHSGARYATTDRAEAVECSAENKFLRRICPGSFEENDGLFVALTDEDVEYEASFLEACWQCAVPTRRLDRDEALRAEPGLNPGLRFAIQVPDATMDAMRVPLRFFATARRNGAQIRAFTEVVGVTMAGRTVSGVRVRDHAAGTEYEIGADIVVNAAGPWAGEVAALAGVEVPIVPSPGVMVAVRGRHCNMVVNRLHSPGDGDIVLPQRGLTVVGTSSWIVDDPDDLTVPAEHVAAILRESADLVPAVGRAEIRAVWSAARPLIGGGAAAGAGASGGGAADLAGRELARELRCFDHATDATPTQGFVTIAGGKATTLRAMAETTADVICGKLGLDRPGQTCDYVLLPHTAWYSQ